MKGVPVSESAPLPSIPRRIGARVIDYVVLGAAGGGLGAATGYGGIWLVATAVLVLAYFVVGDAVAGTTVGKAVLGLRMEGSSGRRPSIRAALARESFVLLGAVPFVGASSYRVNYRTSARHGH